MKRTYKVAVLAAVAVGAVALCSWGYRMYRATGD